MIESGELQPNHRLSAVGAFLRKVVTGGSPVMAWSPVPTSHANKSLSFDLSPSITTAVGAPVVAKGLPESPEYHGVLHSPGGTYHDHDMLEKVRARKLVADAMRGNAKLRQAVSELSQISATEALGKASKKD